MSGIDEAGDRSSLEFLKKVEYIERRSYRAGVSDAMRGVYKPGSQPLEGLAAYKEGWDYQTHGDRHVS